MQTKLEKVAIDERKNETLKSGYNIDNQYSAIHDNALSINKDARGKGTKHGGHTHWLPNGENTSPTTIDYSNFDTEEGGNIYDVEGRNDIGGRTKMLSFSKYGKGYQYGANLIDTEENQRNGQYIN